MHFRILGTLLCDVAQTSLKDCGPMWNFDFFWRMTTQHIHGLKMHEQDNKANISNQLHYVSNISTTR